MMRILSSDWCHQEGNALPMYLVIGQLRALQLLAGVAREAKELVHRDVLSDHHAVRATERPGYIGEATDLPHEVAVRSEDDLPQRRWGKRLQLEQRDALPGPIVVQR